MHTIYPSLIAADLLYLGDTITMLDPYCDGYHIDIMDNHFVPNLTWGPSFIKAIMQATDKKLWIHLMVDDPERWPARMALPPSSLVSFHFETIKKSFALIKQIKENKWEASVAISPEIDPESIFDLLPHVDQVLIMTVNPGFSGQAFLPAMVRKIAPLIDYRDRHGLSFALSMDGGINESNIALLIEQGIQDFAVASAIFGSPDPVAMLKCLKSF